MKKTITSIRASPRTEPTTAPAITPTLVFLLGRGVGVPVWSWVDDGEEIVGDAKGPLGETEGLVVVRATVDDEDEWDQSLDFDTRRRNWSWHIPAVLLTDMVIGPMPRLESTLAAEAEAADSELATLNADEIARASVSFMRLQKSRNCCNTGMSME